jgi:uncharacterized protein YndB with AHSA1/START domain
VRGKRIDGNETTAGEIDFSRAFDLPRRMVWEAWTNPKQLVLRWGRITLRPRSSRWTCGSAVLDAGGACAGWNGPSNKSMFSKEVVPHEQLRYSLNGGKRGGPAVQFEMVATFEDTAGVRLN